MRNARRLLPAALAFVSASMVWAQRSESPSETLLRSMIHGRTTALTAIIQQSYGGMTSQVKLEQQKNGYTRITVLQPLSKQGVSSIDDGKRWVTLEPDKRRLIVQESPRKRMADPKERIGLARQNYTFKYDDPETVAGQDALVVVAIPRAAEIPARRYFVDKATGYMLRMEVVEDGRSVVVHDTKSVTYEAQDVAKPYALNISGPVRQIHVKAPEDLVPGHDSKRVLGFSAVLPRRLPYGFRVQLRQLVGETDSRSLAVRVSDGLIHATVYQWSADREKQPWDFDPEAGDVQFGSIRLKVLGEMPKNVQFKLLEAFVSALRSANRTTEPEAPRRALERAYPEAAGAPSSLDPRRAHKRQKN